MIGQFTAADVSESEASRLTTWLPELEFVPDGVARDRCLRVWAGGLRAGGWVDPTIAPTLFGVPVSTNANLARHTGRVIEACLGVANALNRGTPIDVGVLLEAAALHDVAKLVEYEPTASGFALSEIGRSVHHAAIGASWAIAAGSPVGVVQAIYSHTPQVRAVPKTVEAIILFAVDQVDADATMLLVGREPLIKRSLAGG
jgi:hypothetical protein